MHKTALPIFFSFLLRVTLIRSDVVGNGFSPHKTALPMDGFWNHIMHPIPFSSQSLASGEEQDQTLESSPGANIKSIGTDGYNSSSSGIATSGFDPFDESLSKIYRYRRQQSVNLGSWFVHEEWMTPSVFESAKDPKVSEIDIALGPNARDILENYWSTFITQADFNYLASIGINTVRLPIGYWSLGPSFCSGTPFQSVASVYENSWTYVLNAIKMASNAGIGVLVDLHGAVGSQNGQPHSGVSDGQTGLFDNPDNIGKTLNVLIFLTQQLVNVTNVVGIQILNEPNNVQSLEDFYTKAIAAMRNTSAEARFLPLYVHNGFDLDRFTRYINSRTDFVVQDHHSYFVFTGPDSTEPASQHTSDVHTIIAAQLATSEPKDPFLTGRRNLVVDEWSCALTPESLNPEQNKDQSMRDFCSSQLEVYEAETPGWAFWSYKLEDCDDDPSWCFEAAVRRGYLPQTFFSYNVSTIGFLDQLPLSLTDSAAMLPLGSANSSTGLGHFYQQISALNLDPSLSSSSQPYASRPTSSTYNSQSASPQDKGYSDGYLTATRFALYGLSKLGFVWQYIHDNVQNGNAGVDPKDDGACQAYREAFLQGLKHGEEQVESIVCALGT